MDKQITDSSSVIKERNDAVSQLGKDKIEIQRLESDRRDLFARIDALERQKNDSKESTDTRNNMGDLNLKLKLEMGNLRAENDKLLKAKEETAKEKSEMDEKLLAAKVSFNHAQTELKQTQFEQTLLF